MERKPKLTKLPAERNSTPKAAPPRDVARDHQ